MIVYVVDYSFSRPSLAALKKSGYSGIVRYLSNDPSKNISTSEVAQARMLGMSITLVWESTANRALGGASAGTADGIKAKAQAAAVGLPADRPIYAAVDFGATTSQLGVIGQYVDAFAKATGRPGAVYGSALVIKYCFDKNIAKYGWQAGGPDLWPGNSTLLPSAHLYQRKYPVLPPVAGSYDENVALKDDFGQWPKPVVAPPPQPEKPPVQEVTKIKHYITPYTEPGHEPAQWVVNADLSKRVWIHSDLGMNHNMGVFTWLKAQTDNYLVTTVPADLMALIPVVGELPPRTST